MSGHCFFQVPSSHFDNLKFKSEWDQGGIDWKRKDVDLKVDQVVEVLPKGITLKDNEPTIHFVRYDVDGQHTIDRHDDACYCTILIYLNKDDNLKDEFIVGDETVGSTEERWSHDEGFLKAFAFWGCQPHQGKVEGYGRRDILAIFWGDY